MQATKKVIVIVDNTIAITGAIKASVASSKELSHLYAFIYVLPTGSTAASFVAEAGFAVHFLPFIELSRRPLDLIRYLPQLIINSFRLKRILKEREAAVLHMNDFYNMTGILVRLFGSKVGLVTHVRRMPFSFPKPFGSVWMFLNRRYADKIVCVSQAVFNYFKEEPKAGLIYDWAIVEEKLPERAIDPAMVPQEIKLLYLGNYIQGKGQDKALEAFSKSYRINNRLRLKFVGGDMGLQKNSDFKRQLMERVQKEGLGDVISFSPFTTEIEHEIKSADMVLNFSESESFSFTCFEALYFGTPLIATDSGGPAELFEHGRSGLLVAVNDVEAMQQAILQMADDRFDRAAFARNAKSFVRKKFSKTNTVYKLGALYDKVSA